MTSMQADPWADSGLPELEVAFMKEYFRILDAENEQGAARAWAESWTEEGTFVLGDRVFQGHDALETERHRVWAAWPHLWHDVKRIYVAPGNRSSDILVVASYAIKRPDGSLITQPTAANFQLVRQGENVKIKKCEIFADGSPLLEVMILP